MSKNYKTGLEIMDSLDLSSPPLSPRSILVNSSDSLTGWDDKKDSILGLSPCKTPIRPNHNKSKSVCKEPVKRPATSNTLPTSCEGSPVKKVLVRFKSKDNKAWETPQEDKEILQSETLYEKYEKAKQGEGIEDLKARLKSFNKNSYIRPSDLYTYENMNFGYGENNYGEDKRDFIFERPPGAKKEPLATLLLRAAGSRIPTASSNPFVTKVSDLMGLTISKMNVGKPKVESTTPNSSYNPLPCSSYSSKRKISNQSFYNVNMSYSRKTFMGLSMITPHVPAQKDIHNLDSNTNFGTNRKDSVNSQTATLTNIHTQEKFHSQTYYGEKSFQNYMQKLVLSGPKSKGNNEGGVSETKSPIKQIKRVNVKTNPINLGLMMKDERNESVEKKSPRLPVKRQDTPNRRTETREKGEYRCRSVNYSRDQKRKDLQPKIIKMTKGIKKDGYLISPTNKKSEDKKIFTIVGGKFGNAKPLNKLVYIS